MAKGKTMKTKRVIGRAMVAAGLAALLSAALPLAVIVAAPLVSVINYPNPFDNRSQVTRVNLDLSEDCELSVSIYDLFGNVVRKFTVSKGRKGSQEIIWDGTDDGGTKVAKGGYLLVVRATGDPGKIVAVRKIGVVH
jgi:flagellar hook assembly protein FlgD